MKAQHYLKDSNNIPDSKSLDALVKDDSNLKKMVQTFTNLVGKAERMTYPDRLSIPKIPSDLYKKSTASEAIDQTKSILDYISDRL